MALPPDRLFLVAKAALQAVVDYYADNSVALPDRQYVNDGPLVAWDCEQLVAFVESTFPGLADTEQPLAIDPAGVRSARLSIEVARCSPVVGGVGDQVQLPDPADVEASAQVVLADGVMIASALRAAQKAGDLAGCHGLVLDQWVGLGPTGELVGGRLSFRVQLTQV